MPESQECSTNRAGHVPGTREQGQGPPMAKAGAHEPQKQCPPLHTGVSANSTHPRAHTSAITQFHVGRGPDRIPGGQGTPEAELQSPPRGGCLSDWLPENMGQGKKRPYRGAAGDTTRTRRPGPPPVTSRGRQVQQRVRRGPPHLRGVPSRPHAPVSPREHTPDDPQVTDTVRNTRAVSNGQGRGKQEQRSPSQPGGGRRDVVSAGWSASLWGSGGLARRSHC